MEVLYFTHPSFSRHNTGAWHPERPSRLEAVERGVMTCGLPVRRMEPTPVASELLELVHESSYIDAIERFCAAGGGALDMDTFASPESWEAALRSAGAGPDAVEALRSATTPSVAFLAVRPPGHHALRSQAMGFCLFNNIVVTSEMLRQQGERVVIVDWDVHHGNGTQAVISDQPDVMYVSAHQHPFYPFTGDPSERGFGAAEGTVINAGFPAGSGGDVYRAFFQRVVVPSISQFKPDWLLISAGYDAHEDDPLAELRLLSSDYAAMGRSLSGLVAPSRTILFLEGGYHLPAISASVSRSLTGLAGRDPEPEMRHSPTQGWLALERAVSEASKTWKVS